MSLTTTAPPTLRILGIDPGLQTTGFGVIDITGSRLGYVASGVIETTREEMGNLPARLKVIYDGIREITERYQPDVASVEIVFVNVNPQATWLLGQARPPDEAIGYWPWPCRQVADSGDGQAFVAAACSASTRRSGCPGNGHYTCPCQPVHEQVGGTRGVEP